MLTALWLEWLWEAFLCLFNLPSLHPMFYVMFSTSILLYITSILLMLSPSQCDITPLAPISTSSSPPCLSTSISLLGKGCGHKGLHWYKGISLPSLSSPQWELATTLTWQFHSRCLCYSTPQRTVPAYRQMLLALRRWSHFQGMLLCQISIRVF